MEKKYKDYPTRIFTHLYKDTEFMAKYLYGFIDRFVYSTVDVERTKSIDERRVLIKSLTEALKLCLDECTQNFTPTDLIEIANIINEKNGISGIRKINVSAGNHATFTPIPPNKIYMRFYEIIDQYRNLWCGLNAFEREAMFNIQFMRMHPFEDGNKRVSKILLAANLINAGYAPVLINDTDIDQYYKFLNNQDSVDFGAYLYHKSQEELRYMIGLYKTLKEIPFETSIEEGIMIDKDYLP